MLVNLHLLPSSISLPIHTVSKADQPPPFCPEDLKGMKFISSYFTFPYKWEETKSLLRVLAIHCLPQSTYSVPDMLFDYKTLTQGWTERGVCCAMGKFQKLPNQMSVAQRRIRSFQAVPLQQKSHHWCMFLLHLSSSCPFCHLAKGNLCNKCLNT